MTPIDVIKEIGINIGIQNFNLTFYEHKAEINWQQHNSIYENKIKNFDSSLIHPSHLHSFSLKFSELIDPYFDIYKYLKDSNNVISMSSLVKDDNNFYHIPLMNLHLEKDVDLDHLSKLIKITTNNMSGFLLKTDRYFHFYGEALINEKKWLQFNAQFLMPTILVSPRYIGHCIYKGFNTLRITKTTNTKIIEPYVIARI